MPVSPAPHPVTLGPASPWPRGSSLRCVEGAAPRPRLGRGLPALLPLPPSGGLDPQVEAPRVDLHSAAPTREAGCVELCSPDLLWKVKSQPCVSYSSTLMATRQVQAGRSSNSLPIPSPRPSLATLPPAVIPQEVMPGAGRCAWPLAMGVRGLVWKTRSHVRPDRRPQGSGGPAVPTASKLLPCRPSRRVLTCATRGASSLC